MNLSEKIFNLRKQQGMSQEKLAEQLNVSRQAVSRWEMGSAQPDASNVLQLSKLFGVTTDYLLNDDYESDSDVPVVRKTEAAANQKIKKIIGVCIIIGGVLGNFIIYIFSRAIPVMVPYMTYEDGEKWYTWSGDHMGYSYKYFIQEHNLEFLTVLFWMLVIAGFMIVFLNKNKVKTVLSKWKEKRKKKKEVKAE